MNDEENDQLTTLSSDNSVMEQILLAKTGEPSSFPSFWEMDENDVEVSLLMNQPIPDMLIFYSENLRLKFDIHV